MGNCADARTQRGEERTHLPHPLALSLLVQEGQAQGGMEGQELPHSAGAWQYVILVHVPHPFPHLLTTPPGQWCL